MRRTARWSLLLVVVFVLALLPAAGAVAITPGTPDTGDPPLYPFVGTPSGYELATGAYFSSASTALIHPQVAIASAHSTVWVEQHADAFVWDGVVFDAVWSSDPAAVHPVPIRKVIVHPDYEKNTHGNFADLALIILDEPVPGVTQESLPRLPEVGFLDQIVQSGLLRPGGKTGELDIAGFGYATSWPPPAPLSGEMRRYGVAGLLSLSSWAVAVAGNQAAHDGFDNLCFGDSGGPVYYRDGATLYQVGVVTVNGDWRCVTMGRAVRLDQQWALDWINEVMTAEGFSFEDGGVQAANMTNPMVYLPVIETGD